MSMAYPFRHCAANSATRSARNHTELFPAMRPLSCWHPALRGEDCSVRQSAMLPHRTQLTSQNCYMRQNTIEAIQSAFSFTQFIPGSQRFETERLTIVSVSPGEARGLVGVLLQDEPLASQVVWLEEKSASGALREAFAIELECAAGKRKVWSVIERARQMQIGAVLAEYSIAGLDVEVLVASQFWDQEIATEAAEPVMQWLESITEANLVLG